MKKIFALANVLIASTGLYAQSFTVQHDTVWSTPVGSVAIVNGITATSGDVTIKWSVIGSDFPSDWITNTGICDNNLCYPASICWPSGTIKTSNPYSTTLGDFHLLIDLTTATTLGCYYMTMNMRNQTIPTDFANETYIVCKTSPTASPAIIKSSEDIVLYPNPATNELAILYDISSNIESIAVYNIIGEMIAVNRVSNSPHKFNLDKIPSGQYFVKLLNSHGSSVGMKKFIKQ